MQVVNEQDVVEVRALGNGGQKVVSAADGRVYRLSYLKGVLRVDVYEQGATIPLSARQGGGSVIPIAPAS